MCSFNSATAEATFIDVDNCVTKQHCNKVLWSCGDVLAFSRCKDVRKQIPTNAISSGF